jgi:hypothetical protein
LKSAQIARIGSTMNAEGNWRERKEKKSFYEMTRNLLIEKSPRNEQKIHPMADIQVAVLPQNRNT